MLAAERLDPADLRAAEVEDRLPVWMLDGDRVEDFPDRRRVVVGRRLPLDPAWPDLAGDPDHLRTDGRILLIRPVTNRVDRDVVGAEGVAELLGEQIRAEPALAFSSRKNRVTEVLVEGREVSLRDVCGRPEARRDRGDGLVGSLGGRCLAQGVVDEFGDAR